MDMRTALNAALGGFVGKLVATLFIAVCIALGVGPDVWATTLLGGVVTPLFAQLLFILLAVLTALALGASFRKPEKARALTKAQLLKMQAALSGMKTGVMITRDNDAVDADHIYRQFVALFQELGWAVHGGVALGFNDPPKCGLLLVRRPNVKVETLDAVRTAIETAGLNYVERETSESPDIAMPQIAFSAVPLSLA